MNNKRAHNGEPAAWLESHKNFAGDECLIWPFSCGRGGYAIIRVRSKKVRVPRILCEHRHGPPPTPKHEAAHSCGKGHLGCVNQLHLSWKTSKENNADKLIHGTSLKGKPRLENRGERHGGAKLTEAEVLAIRANCDLSQRILARLYGVGVTQISYIKKRKTWAWL